MSDKHIFIGNNGEILHSENIPPEYAPITITADPARIPFEGCVYLNVINGTLKSSLISKGPVEITYYPEKMRKHREEYIDYEGNPVLLNQTMIVYKEASTEYTVKSNKQLLSQEDLSIILGKPVTYDFVPTADHVRTECQRRLIALLNARDEEHLDLLIKNGTREAVRLLRKKDKVKNWTQEEEARAQELENLDLAIEAIRAASNAMEENPPANYKDDSNWPNFS